MKSPEKKQNATHDNLNLLEVLQPLLKWWWLLAISALLAIFASTLYTLQQPLVYSSTTTIMVGTALSEPNPNGNEFSLANQLAAAYADIANRSTIQNATKAALGLTWLPEYVAHHVPNTQLLEITVVDTIPERAQAVSAMLAQQLVLISPGGQSQKGRQQFIDEQLAQIEQAITQTDAEIERLELEMTQMFSARQIADTRAQLAALEAKRSSLQNNYSAMFSNSNRSATNTVVIVEEAALPTTPLNDDLLRNILLAAVLGAAIAAAGAYLLEYSNNTIKSERELQLAHELVTLGLIPPMHHNNTPQQPVALLSTQTNRSDATDAYAALRLNLQSLIERQAINTIAITGLMSDEQYSLVTANLCIEIARGGAKVILVDADLHSPSQQRFFNLTNRFGLSTLLADDTLLPAELLQTTEIRGLSILPSGPLPANPAALLGHQRLCTVLAQLRSQADIVIFNLPPVNAVVDALLLANEMDGLILTVVSGQTRRQDVDQVLEALNRIDVEVLGAILCSASPYSIPQAYSASATPPRVERLLPQDEQLAHHNGNLNSNLNSNHHNNNHHNGYGADPIKQNDPSVLPPRSQPHPIPPTASPRTQPPDSNGDRPHPLQRRNPFMKR